LGYVFDPDVLHEIAKLGVGLDFDEACRVVVGELAVTYPGHIERGREWVFNLAGGATGIMDVLHGSMTEYMIIFGSPIGTEAFSGRYPLDIHDFVLSGTMYTYTEDNPGDALVSGPGDRALLRRGQVKGFRLDPGCWMLEYGRGFVPGALHTTLVDVLVRGLDLPILTQTFRVYGMAVIRELLQGKL